MDIRKIKKLENMKHEFQFVNEWGRTRNGFYHKSTLFMLYDNGGSCDVNTAKVNYLNRTWESYNFQTSMQRCVLDFIDLLRIIKMKMVFQDYQKIKEQN